MIKKLFAFANSWYAIPTILRLEHVMLDRVGGWGADFDDIKNILYLFCLFLQVFFVIFYTAHVHSVPCSASASASQTRIYFLSKVPNANKSRNLWDREQTTELSWTWKVTQGQRQRIQEIYRRITRREINRYIIFNMPWHFHVFAYVLIYRVKNKNSYCYWHINT
jgi:hypothetical protein